MYCGNCGQQIPDSSATCPNCGKEIAPAPKKSFCPNCGAPVMEGKSFCAACGAKLNIIPAAGGKNYVRPDRRKTTVEKSIKTGLIAIVVLLMLVLCVSLFGGRSYKKVVDQYVKASFSADGAKMVELIPKEIFEDACDDEYITRQEGVEKVSEQLQDYIDTLDNYYDNWKTTYEIVETRDYDSDELEDLQEELQERYQLKVKEAKRVTVELTVQSNGEELGNRTMEITTIKIGNSWYFWGGSSSIF